MSSVTWYALLRLRAEAWAGARRPRARDRHSSGFIEPLVENDRGIASRCREGRARLNSKSGFRRRVVTASARLALGWAVLTEQEVLDGLAAAELPTLRTRFENWRERGLIVPSGPRKGLGHGKGREAHLYPDGTVEQAIEIAKLRGQNLNLDEIGWRLWLEGRHVGRQCWFGVFEAVAAEIDAAVSELREALDSDDLDKNPIEELAEKVFTAKTSDPAFRQFRKAVGPERLPAILLHFASMASGGFTSISVQMNGPGRDSTRASIQLDPEIREQQSDFRAMDAALGFAHARTDTVNGDGPIIEGDYSSILRNTFAPLAETTLTEFLVSVDPDHLRTTTRDISAFTQSLAAASQVFDRAFAKDAFGFRRAALLARSERKQQALTGLMWALIFEKSAEKFHDVGTMAEKFDAAATSARELPQSAELAENSRRPTFRRGTSQKPIK